MYPDTIATNNTLSERDGILTSKEWDFLELLAKGLTNKAIAEKFFLVEKTIQDRSYRVYAKLGFSLKPYSNPRVLATLWYWGLNGARDVKQN